MGQMLETFHRHIAGALLLACGALLLLSPGAMQAGSVSGSAVEKEHSGAGCELRVSVEGRGAVTVTGATGVFGRLTESENLLPLACGEEVVLTAAPDAQWSFEGWEGVATSERIRRSITVRAPATITAVFQPRPIVRQPVETPFYDRSGELVTSIERFQPLSSSLTENRLDMATASAPTVTPWYGNSQTFGEIGLPQEWINILGNVTDVDDNLSSITYSLNSGAAQTVHYGGDGSVADGRRLWNAGDINIDIDKDLLSNGANTLSITATDSGGLQTVEEVTINYSDGNSWPIPTRISWPTDGEIEDVAQVVDGKWEITESGVHTMDTGYDRLITLGQGPMNAGGWAEFEVTVEVTVHGYDPAGFTTIQYAPAVGVVARWQGHTDTPVVCPQPKCGWLPVGASAWYEWKRDQSGDAFFSFWTHHGSKQADPSGLMMDEDQTYYWKVRVDNSLGPRGKYYLKVWKVTDPEPEAWLITFDDSQDNKPQQSLTYGSLLLLAHHVDVTFGDIEVNHLWQTQCLDLDAGWNTVSSNLTPNDAALETLLAPISNELVLMKDDEGNVYWPDKNVPGITEWQPLKGYQIYMESEAELCINGSAIDPAAMPITLPQGWSLISYLPDAVMSPALAFADIGEELVLAKNGYGQVYWPTYGSDQIVNMQPGQAYHVYLSTEATFTYPGSGQ